MNRCFSGWPVCATRMACTARSTALLAATVLGLSAPLGASAQVPVAAPHLGPQRTFPPHAQRALMVVLNAHEVTLNGQRTRLSPGSRIRTPHNALVVSGGLVGQALVVNYTRDTLGQAHDIWILSAAEAAQPRAGAENMVITNIVSGQPASTD